MTTRQTLLLETLLKRQITRPGPVYLYRKPQGPPLASKEKLDRTLWAITQGFDFGPLMTGDQQQARQVAQEYLSYLRKRAAQHKVPYSELRRRLKEISPHMRRGLMTFYTYFDAKVKTAS